MMTPRACTKWMSVGTVALLLCAACGSAETRAGDGVVRLSGAANIGHATPHNWHHFDPQLPPGHCREGFTRRKFDRWYYLRKACGIGHYNIAYPVEPGYRHPRDGHVFAAQGYGIPMATPIAPMVTHEYNYSDGPQGSRLTPISRYVP